MVPQACGDPMKDHHCVLPCGGRGEGRTLYRISVRQRGCDVAFPMVIRKPADALIAIASASLSKKLRPMRSEIAAPSLAVHHDDAIVMYRALCTVNESDLI